MTNQDQGAVKLLGYAVMYRITGDNKLHTPASKSPELAKANWLAQVIGVHVTSEWTKPKVNENFDFYGPMQGARVIKVYIEELESKSAGT